MNVAQIPGAARLPLSPSGFGQSPFGAPSAFPGAGQDNTALSDEGQALQQGQGPMTDMLAELSQLLAMLMQMMGQGGASPSGGGGADPSGGGGADPSAAGIPGSIPGTSGGGGGGGNASPSSGGSSGGSGGGSPAASPAASSPAAPTAVNNTNPGGDIVPNVPDGSYGGQCGSFVAKQTGGAFPDATAKQFLDPNGHPGFYVTNTPQPGDIFVCRGGKDGIPTDTGHTGFVKSVNSNGTLTVVDSNWNYDEKVHTHSLPASAVDGYLRKNGT